MTSDPWDLRASDADRDRYLQALREAYAEGRLDASEYEDRMQAALAAKTYRELQPVVADLPVKQGQLPGPPSPHLPVPVRRDLPATAAGPTQLTGIFNSVAKKGVWQMPESLPVIAVMGEVKLDLTEAVLSGYVTEIKCVAVMGEVNVIVPDTLRVELDGVPVMAEFGELDKRKGAAKGRPPAPDAPLVRLTGFAFMGSVKARIVSAPERRVP